MPITHYNSVAAPDSPKRPKKNRASELAHDSFEAFRPFINVFDCGIDWHGPIHLITKEDWRLFDQYKAGDKNLRNPDGKKFNPYLHVVRNIFGPEHVHRHIEEGQTTYYTSGKKGLGLLYLDIDAHRPWQTDEYKAKAVLQKLFPFGYFRASRRGQNGYLKVRYTSIPEFNETADFLQERLKRLFLHLGILCDVEVKGTITHGGKSGSLAKLPFANKIPCCMRDKTDSWNYCQLRLFQACPVVCAKRVEHLISQTDRLIDEEKVSRFQEHKKGLEAKEKAKQQAEIVAERRTWEELGSRPDLKNKTVDDVGPGSPAQQASNRTIGRLHQKPADARKKRGVVRPGTCDGNAFLRNQKVLLPFVREFFKKSRRFPDTDDALALTCFRFFSRLPNIAVNVPASRRPLSSKSPQLHNWRWAAGTGAATDGR